MKLILFTLSILFSISLTADPVSVKNAKDFEQIIKKMCTKTDECVKKAFANLPPEQRKAAGNFSQVKVCMAGYEQYGRNPAPGKGKERTITKEDLENLKKCADEFSNTSCDDLGEGKQPDSCLKFKEKSEE